MAVQYSKYLQERVHITESERQYAQGLVDMIKSVETEGIIVENVLRNDALKEIVKALLRE